VVQAATNRQVTGGAAWMLLFKVADKSVGLVSTIVLARLLVPADFGLVAMAMSVIAFTQLMGAFGFDTALIQRQDATRDHYDTAWTFNVALAGLMAATLAMLAVPAAHFYQDDRLVAIIGVLAIGTLGQGFSNIGVVAFRKELDFRSEFKFLFIKRIAAFAVTMALALAFRTYWALVLGTVVGNLLSVVISYCLHAFRPRFSLKARADLFHFSKWIFLSSLIGFLGGRAAHFILGRTVGATGLGLYTVSYEIAVMPSTDVIGPINRAVYPAYCLLAADRDRFYPYFLKIFGVICLIAAPVSAVLFGVAGSAVDVVLGAKWSEAAPLIQLLVVCGLVGALQSNLYLALTALGKPQVSTLLSGVLLVSTLPVIAWASLTHGVLGATYGMVFHALMNLVGILFLFKRYTGYPLRPVLTALWRPLLCGTGVAAVLAALDTGTIATLNMVPSAGRFIGLSLAGSVVYVLSLWLLWRACGSPVGAERAVMEFLKARWHQRNRPRHQVG
jgi:lipopolysaccharide exporter